MTPTADRRSAFSLCLLLRSLRCIVSFDWRFLYSGSPDRCLNGDGSGCVVEAELELFSHLEVGVLNAGGEPPAGERVKDHLDAASLVCEGRTRDLDIKPRLIVVALEGEASIELFQLPRGADLVLSLTVDGNGLEDLIRTAHEVDAA